MPALLDRAKALVAEVRQRRPFVDHLVRTQEHYSKVDAGQQAGAVTYFAFLSFFPVLALAVFVVGWLSLVYPDADQDLREAVGAVVPGLVGTGPDQLSLEDIRTFSGWAAVVGLAGVLYSGLGWISALRDALLTVFEVPERRQPGFVSGKLRDLRALVVLGLVLFVAVVLSGFVAGFAQDILGWLEVDEELAWLVKLLTVVLGLAANVVLFFLMFRLLAEPAVPTRSLWSGAVAGAVGFEVLKQLSGLLLQSTKGQPAFQAFGIALVLVVWINYTSRMVLYAASWASTTREALAARVAEPADPVQGPQTPSLEELQVTARNGHVSTKAAFAAGAVAGATAAVVAKKVQED